jgi:pyruvate kinase
MMIHRSLAASLRAGKKPLLALRRTLSSITKVPPTAWNTKIVCTLGPASNTVERLEAMVDAGMDVCRLNFSHGSHESHQETFDLVRSVSVRYGHQVALLCDIQGPKIRTGKMKEAFEIHKGDKIRVTPEECLGTPERIQIKYETLINDLDKDDVVFINDGTVKLIVLSKDGNDLVCECAAAGAISDNKGCNMPSGRLSVDVVTEKDAKDLEFIAKLNPEFVAASFVGTGQDIQTIRSHLSAAGNPNVKIIAKLERPVALENLDDIIAESDALMVARGDLGVEIESWDVPVWQKEIISRCNRESKPVIVATQMLESMIENARPTRAEASDVFNAVLDGADAVMLSGETSVGKHPVEAVQVMDEIVRTAQDHMPAHDPEKFHSKKGKSIAENVCMAVHAFAEQFNDEDYEGKILVITRSGFAARQISKYHPSLPILAFSDQLRTVRELALNWGVKAHYLPQENEDSGSSFEERGLQVIKTACDLGFVHPKDERVCVLAPSAGGSAGYICAVFDVQELSKNGFQS